MKNPKIGEIWSTINHRIVKITGPIDKKNKYPGIFLNDGKPDKVQKGEITDLTQAYLSERITKETNPEYFV